MARCVSLPIHITFGLNQSDFKKLVLFSKNVYLKLIGFYPKAAKVYMASRYMTTIQLAHVIYISTDRRRVDRRNHHVSGYQYHPYNVFCLPIHLLGY